MALGGRTDLSPANQLQRLRVRHEKQADIHEAFLSLGRSLICWRWERAASPFGDERSRWAPQAEPVWCNLI